MDWCPQALFEFPVICRGNHITWPTGPESHPQESQISTFKGKQALGRATREAPQDTQIITFQVKGVRVRDAPETAGGRPGREGGTP